MLETTRLVATVSALVLESQHRTRIQEALSLPGRPAILRKPPFLLTQHSPCEASKTTMRCNTLFEVVERAAMGLKSRIYTYIYMHYIVAQRPTFSSDILSINRKRSFPSSRLTRISLRVKDFNLLFNFTKLLRSKYCFPFHVQVRH